MTLLINYCRFDKHAFCLLKNTTILFHHLKLKNNMSFINCTVIKRIKQDELKTFTDEVFENMNGKAVYAFF